MQKMLILTLILALPAFAQEKSADSRAAAGCGPVKEQFDVKTDKNQHAVGKPQPGKALVYIITQERTKPNTTVIGHPTSRIGLDGNWIGANKGDSYFFFAVEPGKHHVCTDLQSRFKKIYSLSGAASLNAEKGKTYFFHARLTLYSEDHPNEVKLESVDEAEGELLISKSALSTPKVKKK